MKRVLSLVLALVLVLGMIPTFAADMTAGQHLYEHEFIAGVGNGELNEAGLLTREQLAKLILELNGSKEEAEVLTLPPSYTDSAKISAWARPYVAYAQIEGLMVGFTDGSFRPQAGVSGQQLAQVLTRALGYEFSWATVVAEAADLGIEVATGAALTRGEAFEAMWTTVNTNPKDGDKPLGVVLGKLVDPNPPVGPLAVSAVTASNAKEVVVKFNQPVNETEGKKVANYTVKTAGGTDLVVSAVSLSEDKTTATLTVTTAIVNYATSTVIVDKAVGLAANYTTTFTLADEAIPTLLSVTATGPREMTLLFSEPVQGATNAAFKLDNGTVALGTVTTSGTKLILNSLSDLTEGSHTLTLAANSAIKDYVNLVVKPGSYSFNYAKDTTVPTVMIKESSEYTVTLKFSKNVTNVNTAAVLFSHTYDGQNQVAGNVAVTGANDEYVVTFTNPLAPGASNMYIGYASGTTDANKIKDNFGNVLAATSLTVTTVVDNVAPVAEKVEFKTATTATVTFSEKVTTATANVVANYTLKDSAAKAVTISNANLDSTGKVVTLTFTALNGGDYSLTVKNIKDISIAANKMADTTLTFTASDKVNPTIVDVDSTTVGVQAQTVAAKKVIVKFSEAMDVASITNKANYLLNGNPLATNDTITAVDGNKGALITFDAAPGAATLTVGRVADAAGNLTVAFSSTVLIPAAVSSPLFDVAEVTGKNTVKLYFDEVITGAVAADFEVDPGDNTFDAVTGIAVTVVDGKTEITLIIAQDILAQDAQSGNVEVRTTGAVEAVNAYGAVVVIGATPADDAMAPSVVANGYETMDVDKDGKIDHIKVTFDEKMFAGSVSMDKFTVAGYTVADAYASANVPTATDRTGITVADAATIYVRLTEKTTGYDTDATPAISIAAGLKDASNVAFAAVTDKATVDKAKPVMVSAKATAATTLEITYSEAVSTSAVGATDWVYDADGAGAGAAAVTASVAATDGTLKTVVLTLPGGTFTTGTAVAAATITYTQAANDIDDGVTATAGNAAVTPQTITGVTSGF